MPLRDPLEPPLPPPSDAPVAPGAPPADRVPPELQPLAARYEVFGELGRGGMAVVYHGRERTRHGDAADRAPGREVAIKVVSPRYTGDRDAARRFEREARMVAALDHPNIVRTLGIEPLADGAVAIVSRYVPGETLREALQRRGAPLDYARAAAVLRDLAAALAHAHARRIVHRDVKPENVFLEDPSGRALLADFGIARPLDIDSPLTIDGSAFGTPNYMAPEQVTGRPVDERTDVYALGLVGWEMLAGRRPWQGETLYTVLHKQQHEALPDLALVRPDIPAYLLAAIDGAVAKDPSRRWRDGAELLSRLTPAPVLLPELPTDQPAAELPPDQTIRIPATATQPVALERGGATVPARGATRAVVRRRARWLATAAVLAVLGIGGTALARRQGEVTRRAADAATTGVTDAELEAMLRAASAAAPLPDRGALSAGARGSGAGGRAGAPPAAAPSATPPSPRRPSAATVPAVTPRPTSGRPAGAPARSPSAAQAGAAAATPAVREAVAARTSDPRCSSPASADQRACLMSAVARTDVGLNRDYQVLIADLRRQAGGAAEPPAVATLRAEQRAWLDARDRQCRAAVAGSEGALWGAARAPCFAALSERRAAELRTRLGGEPVDAP